MRFRPWLRYCARQIGHEALPLQQFAMTDVPIKPKRTHSKSGWRPGPWYYPSSLEVSVTYVYTLCACQCWPDDFAGPQSETLQMLRSYLLTQWLAFFCDDIYSSVAVSRSTFKQYFWGTGCTSPQRSLVIAYQDMPDWQSRHISMCAAATFSAIQIALKADNEMNGSGPSNLFCHGQLWWLTGVINVYRYL